MAAQHDIVAHRSPCERPIPSDAMRWIPSERLALEGDPKLARLIDPPFCAIAACFERLSELAEHWVVAAFGSFAAL